MRNKRFLLPFAILAALGLAACDNGVETDEQAMNEAEQAGDEMAAETEQAAAETEQATRDALGMEESGSAGAEVALTVEQSPQLGEYLADSEGRAVYMLEADSQGQSKCMDDCAQQWPPVVADSGQPKADDPSIQESKLSTIQREDGTQQVAYNGHPLYYYAQDRGPGQTSGQQKQDQWGEWYLVSAEGEQLEGQQGSQQQRQQ